jgi:hypothetical protein
MNDGDLDLIVKRAEGFAKEYIEHLTFDGKADPMAIVEALKSRTFQGEPVVHLIVDDPINIRQAIELGVRLICTVNVLEKAEPKKRAKYAPLDLDMLAYREQLIAQFPDVVTELNKAQVTKSERSQIEKDTKRVLKSLRPAECIWDYYYMSYYGSAFKADGLENPTEFIRFDFLPAMAAGLGYIINLGSLTIGVVQPEARRDDQQLLHCPNGPALIWGSWQAFYWHGTEIPKEWVLDTANVPVATALNHPNIEQRRCFAEIVGWAKVLEQLKPEVLDEDLDENGNPRQLLLVDLPDAPKEKFCRVICGTGRTFAIPVSPTALTALDAIAESYGVPPDVYKLVERRA